MSKSIRKPSDADDQLKAVSHPIRREIFRAFNESDGCLSPVDLSRSLRVSLACVSYHVRVLAGLGAIELVRTRPVRGSTQHFYQASPEFFALPWVVAMFPKRRGQQTDQE